MKVAAILALQSIPFAGLALSKPGQNDILTVLYVTALGLVLSLIALVDGYGSFSSLLATSVEALQ